MINKMVKVRKHGQIMLVIKVGIKMERKMASEYLNGVMVVVMKVNFHKMKFKEMENILGKIFKK